MSYLGLKVIASCHYFLSDLFVCDHLEEEPSDSESSESDIDLSPQAVGVLFYKEGLIPLLTF